MFALLIVTGQVSAELDAAAGYTSIYGDSGSSQALSSIAVPSVPWGSHAADHGNTFTPNASWYLKTSSPLALDGGAASGRVVNARHADGCADNANGYGCHFNGNIGGKAMRSY